jgi:CRISPR-associated endonuclease/helicase Cas3
MKKLYSFKLKSHNNKLLFNHLKNVASLSKEIIMSKRINDVDLNNLGKLSYLIGISHDFGKSTSFFQNKLNNNEKTENAQHSFISSLFGYFLTKKLLKEKNYPLYTWIVISRHHSDIKNLITDERYKLQDKKYQEIARKQAKDIKENFFNEVSIIYTQLLNEINLGEKCNIVEEFLLEVEKNYDKLVREIENSIRNIVFEENLDNYFMILLLYSVLLDADKLDGCGYSEIPKMEYRENEKLTPQIIKEYLKNKTYPRIPINDLRNQAFNEVMMNLERIDLNERILSINLPTGLGKTLIGLSVALRLRKRINEKLNFYPKIIYSLPFLSIIDQNSEVIRNILSTKFKEISSRIFLQHHHLSDISYIDNKENEFESLDPSKSLVLIEGWHSEIIITTFLQLFHSIITNKNHSARKFHNIINSILILDEIQNIPVKYWKILSLILENMSTKFNCWVIIMSATQPLIFKDKVKSLVDDEYRYFYAMNRYTITFKGKISIEEFKTYLKKEIEETNKDILIILNTVKSCKDIYRFIKSLAKEKYIKEKIYSEGYVRFGSTPDNSLILINLSTLIIPQHRLKRINFIKENKNCRKIIVTTQLIEAGVDISVDEVIRDFAPIDSIIQSAGRCNRNFEREEGEVTVVNLKDVNERYLSTYIYDPTLIEVSEKCIKEIISNDTIFEREFSFRIQEKYYNILSNKSVQIENTSEDIKRLNFSRISEFKLIEEEPNMDILIEINKTATKNLNRIKSLVERFKESKKNKFEILAKIEKEKRKLAKYIISIPFYRFDEKISSLPEALKGAKTFRKVDKENIKHFYDIESGFYIDETTEMNII